MQYVFREWDGRMHVYDPYGVMPAARIGFFETPTWFGTVLFLLVLAAFGSIYGAFKQSSAGKASLASWLIAAVGALWVMALALLVSAALPWAGPDQGVVVYTYPGTIFPLACWLLLIAALVTPALFALTLWKRPVHWRWANWVRAGATFAILAAASVTAWDWGLLGFSGY